MPKLPVCIAGLYFDNEMVGKDSGWGVSYKGRDFVSFLDQLSSRKSAQEVLDYSQANSVRG